MQRLLTDNSPRLREALRYTIYGRNSSFDAERFIDVMEAFETFTLAAKSGGGEEMQGSRAFSGAVAGKSPLAGGLGARQQQGGVQTRAALNFLISEQGDFFREFILDEVLYARIDFSGILASTADVKIQILPCCPLVLLRIFL